MENNPKHTLLHCSAVSRKLAPKQFWAVNRYHKSRLFPTSSLGYNGGYHFFYEPDGTELRYREDWEIGAHCNQVVDGLSMNLQSIGLCWAGDGDTELPTEPQVKAMKRRLKKLVAKYNIPIDNVHISPHRRWTPWKSCFGSLLADDWGYLLVEPKEKQEYEKVAEKEIIEMKTQLDYIFEMILKLKILINKLLKRGRIKS